MPQFELELMPTARKLKSVKAATVLASTSALTKNDPLVLAKSDPHQ